MKHAILNRINLHTLLLGLVLLAFAPAALATAWLGVHFRQQSERLARESSRQAIQAFISIPEQIRKSTQRLLGTLTFIPDIRTPDPEACSTVFHALLNSNPEFANLYLLAPDGSVSCAHRPPSSSPAGPDWDFFRQARDAKTFSVGRVYIDDQRHRAIIPFAAPVTDANGDVASVLVLEYDLAAFGTFGDALRLPEGTTFVLCDASGTILYRHPEPERWLGKGIQASLRPLLAAPPREAAIIETGLDGVRRLYIFQRFRLAPESGDIFIRIGIPETAVFGQAYRLLASSMTAMALFALAILLVARVLGRRFILRPVQSLVLVSQRLAGGELDARCVLPASATELHALCNAFNSMAEALEEREYRHLAIEEKLCESEQRIRALLNATPDSAMLIDTQGRILIVNEQAAQRRGKHARELLDQDIADFLPSDSAMIRKNRIGEVVERKTGVVFDDFRQERCFRIRLYPIFDASGQVVQLASFSRDITDRLRAEERLRHQAFHDELTGLPNRAQFMRRLHEAIDRYKGDAMQRYGMLFFDLDNFKLINDSFGHTLGDQLLKQLASRLARSVPRDCLPARFGGDEFAVLFDRLFDMTQILRLADRLKQLIREPFSIDGYEMQTSASFGVVFGKHEYTEPEQVLRDADIAMYQAKDQGKGQSVVFDLSMHNKVLERMHLEQSLRTALHHGQIFLHFQPIFSLDTLQLGGFEALVRWNHPERGLVPPGVFIPIAEETGQILALGEFVLHQACRQARDWLDRFDGQRPFTMNVNLSGRQFYQTDPVELVRQVLKDTGVGAQYLKLELTESLLLEDLDTAKEILETLRHFGVRTALDDFGTGYSSLGYLRALPFDTLKMDRSFISHLHESERDARIVRIIIDLAHALGMDVVAEGIETEDILKLLSSYLCNYAQGYLLSRPLPAADVEQYFTQAARCVQ